MTDSEGTRIDRWLAERVDGRARNQIQNDLEAGLIRVAGKVQPARYRVRLGELIEYDLPEVIVSTLQPESIPLNIVFEDEFMIVIDKPAGLVVHPAPGHASGTVANALLAHCGPSLEGVGGEDRWGLVHRLDSLTSGLMMAAKTQPAYEALVEALSERRVSRQYLGVVIGSFKEDEGTVDRPIGRRPNDRKRMGVAREGEGREARTDWRLLCQSDGLALLGLALHSGRTHQIRVHLQSVGHPILGDNEYGWTRSRTLQMMEQHLRNRVMAVWPERQLLHAAKLSFEHPILPDTPLTFQSPLPEDMRRVVEMVWDDQYQPALKAWYQG